jgi:hypothetical protein
LEFNSFICGSLHHSCPFISKPSHKPVISSHFLSKGVVPSHVHTSPIPRKSFVVLLSAFDPSNLRVERGNHISENCRVMSHTDALSELLNPGLPSLPTGNVHLESTLQNGNGTAGKISPRIWYPSVPPERKKRNLSHSFETDLFGLALEANEAKQHQPCHKYCSFLSRYCMNIWRLESEGQHL